MLEIAGDALKKKVRVVVVTRPATDFKDRQDLEEILGLLQEAGIELVRKSNIHQKFAVLDQKIVWYGSINLLSLTHS